MKSSASVSASLASRAVRSGALLGIGAVAAVDEIIFHQLLAWHHFYDGSTGTIGILTDGLLHAGELIALALGSVGLWRLRDAGSLSKRHAWSGFFLGAGGFQLFDGLIVHKVLKFHQIRYVDNLLPYDLAWNGAALCLLWVGLYLTKPLTPRNPA